MVIAGHGRAASQKTGQSPRSQGTVYQIALGPLMPRDAVAWVAAEKKTFNACIPRQIPGSVGPLFTKRLYQFLFLFVKSFSDITAAGEQQSAAQGGVGTISAADEHAAGGIYGGGVIAQTFPPARDKNSWDHSKVTSFAQLMHGKKKNPGKQLRVK